jgi:hypothetical protein
MSLGGKGLMRIMWKNIAETERPLVTIHRVTIKEIDTFNVITTVSVLDKQYA